MLKIKPGHVCCFQVLFSA